MIGKALVPLEQHARGPDGFPKEKRGGPEGPPLSNCFDYVGYQVVPLQPPLVVPPVVEHDRVLTPVVGSFEIVKVLPDLE